MFPFDRVYKSIDGRWGIDEFASDMPTWAAVYLVRAGEDSIDVPYDPELYVRTRILALTEHVAHLQDD